MRADVNQTDLSMQNFDLIAFDNDDKLAEMAAFKFWKAAMKAHLDKVEEPSSSDLAVALSGGRIAVKLYFAIVAAGQAAAKAANASLPSFHVFWADERCVPPNSPDSNFSVANELLLTPLGAAKDHVHRIRGEEPPEFACAEAEAEICRVAHLNGDGLPVLDLVILGLGEDGHVASLFPGRPVPEKKAAYQIVTDSPKPPPNRISLSYDAIAAAKEVWVLVSGKGKEEALRESLRTDGKTPLRRVINLRERTEILSDVQV